MPRQEGKPIRRTQIDLPPELYFELQVLQRVRDYPSLTALIRNLLQQAVAATKEEAKER